MFYATEGFITPDPDSTKLVMTVREALLSASDGFSGCMSILFRPSRYMAHNDAKSLCLHPNVARFVARAIAKEFGAAAVLDPVGNVVEFA